MQNNPTVSVVIPSYNYARILPLCIQSVLNQTYPVKEIIVVDDHSTDDSFAVAQGFPVIVTKTQKNSGVAGARNTGYQASTGDIVFFLDSDIVLASDAVEQTIREFEKADDIASVCGIFDPEPLIVDSVWEEFRALQGHVWRSSSEGVVSAGFFAMGAIKRSYFELTGPFNTTLRQTEEVDYGERLSHHGKIFLSAAVRGRHNDEYELKSMMRKLWRRAQDRVPFYFSTKRPMKGFELPRRLLSTMLIFLAAMCVILGVIEPTFLTVSTLFFITTIVLEFDLYSFAYRKFSVGKGILFHCWYIAFHLSAAGGIIVGIFKYLTSRDFRRMYQS